MQFIRIYWQACAIIVSSFAVFTSQAANPAGSVTLAWNPSTEAVTGYRLYYGTASQTYTNMIDVGNGTTATVSNLTAVTTYYFAATAYDASGLESPFSGEISYTLPLVSGTLATLQLYSISPSQILLSGMAPAGNQYDVQATHDFSTWTTIGSVTASITGTIQFSDPGSATNSSRSYRLYQTFP